MFVQKKITNFNVGPAQLYSGVSNFYSELLETGIGSISHRSAEFTDISKSGLSAARKFFNIPENYKIYYTYSATESMELVVRSLVEKKSLHVVNGNFGKVWYKTAVHNGKETQKFENICPKNSSAHVRVPFSDITNTDIQSADVINITGSETASGIGYTPDEISEFSEKIKNVSENTLLAVDITSGMGGINYNFSSADVWLFSVQKSLGLPAGLGFLVLSPKAYLRSQKIEEERKNKTLDFGNHHAISTLEAKMNEKCQTPTTPNVLAIAGFGYICKAFIKNFGTIDALSKFTDEKAEYIYSFFESEKNTSDFIPAIDEKNTRTKTVIVIKLKNAETLSEEEIQEKMQHQHKKLEKHGYVVATGYGKLKKTQFRIANFPVHTMGDIEELLHIF